jgi:indolepyruvate ferredoxin oxidoreductase beta subunit
MLTDECGTIIAPVTSDTQSAVCNLPSAICNLPSAICNLPSAICHLPSAICHLPSANCHLPSAICHTFDIYLVGVGGQGVLTIGEIIAEAAFRKGLSVNFYPTKGMAQRGGSVKAQLRLGRPTVGPAIPEKGADLVVAAEVSEALKAIRYVKPDGDFVLYAHIWAPTAVMLGKAPYPKLEQVIEAVQAALGGGARVHVIPPESLPLYEDAPVPDNIFTLAVALHRTPLGDLLPPAEVEAVVRTRWQRGAARNVAAFRAGLT